MLGEVPEGQVQTVYEIWKGYDILLWHKTLNFYRINVQCLWHKRLIFMAWTHFYGKHAKKNQTVGNSTRIYLFLPPGDGFRAWLLQCRKTAFLFWSVSIWILRHLVRSKTRYSYREDVVPILRQRWDGDHGLWHPQPIIFWNEMVRWTSSLKFGHCCIIRLDCRASAQWISWRQCAGAEKDKPYHNIFGTFMTMSKLTSKYIFHEVWGSFRHFVGMKTWNGKTRERRELSNCIAGRVVETRPFCRSKARLRWFLPFPKFLDHRIWFRSGFVSWFPVWDG